MVNDKRAFRSIWRWRRGALLKHIGPWEKKLIDRRGTGMMGLFGFPAPSTPSKGGGNCSYRYLGDLFSPTLFSYHVISASLPPNHHQPAVNNLHPHGRYTISRRTIYFNTLKGVIKSHRRDSISENWFQLKRSIAAASVCKWVVIIIL